MLQHQFWDLEVGEDQFAVTLSFSNQPERLTIPFAAITTFADPSVEVRPAVPGPRAPRSREAPALPAPPKPAEPPAAKKRRSAAELVAPNSVRTPPTAAAQVGRRAA